MRRVNVFFLAIVVGATMAGAAAATSFGTELRTIDTISVIEGQIGTDVTALEVADQELRLTVHLTNPTGYTLRLRGTFVRVFQGGPTQLAYGTGQRLDDRRERIPARGELTVRYAVGLTPEQSNQVRAAVASDPVRLTVFHSLTLRDEPFRIARTNVTVSGTVAD